MTDRGLTISFNIKPEEVITIFDTIYIDTTAKTKHYSHNVFIVEITDYNFKIKYVVKNLYTNRQLFKGVELNKKFKETLKDIQFKLNSEYIKKKKLN